MGRATRITGVVAATLIMMSGTAAAISAVNIVVAQQARSSGDVVASPVVADAAPLVAGPVSLTALKPLSDAPLPRINVKKLVQQAAAAPAPAVATVYAPTAPVAPAPSHEGEREDGSDGGGESDD